MIDSASLALTDALGGFAGLEGHGFRTRLPVHVHATYVLGVIDSGSLLVAVQGREFVAGPGSVLTLPPFTPHRELPLSATWSFRYLYPSEQTVRRALLARDDGDGTSLAFPEPVFDDPAIAERIGLAHAMVQRGDHAGMEDARAAVPTGPRTLRSRGDTDPPPDAAAVGGARCAGSEASGAGHAR